MSTPFRNWRSMVYTAGTRAVGGNVYGDGTVYQSVRSKDSEIATIDLTAHEYKTLWYAATADIEKLQQRMVELEEVAQRALEALEEADEIEFWNKQKQAITAIKQALAAQPTTEESSATQPAQPAPVAVVSGYYGGQCVILPIDPARIFDSNTALYTSPPQRTWIGLMDEQIHGVVTKAVHERKLSWLEFKEDDQGEYTIPVLSLSDYQMARAIEAKLKEKNHG